MLAKAPDNQVNASFPRGTSVAVRPNRYQTRRARHRLQLGSAVADQRGPVGVRTDQRTAVRVRDVHDLFGAAVAGGTYTGAPVDAADDRTPRGRRLSGLRPCRLDIRRRSSRSSSFCHVDPFISPRRTTVMTDRATHVLDAGALRATPRDLLDDIFGWDVITLAAALRALAALRHGGPHPQHAALEVGSRGRAAACRCGSRCKAATWCARHWATCPPRVRALHRRYGVAHRVRYAEPRRARRSPNATPYDVDRLQVRRSAASAPTAARDLQA